MLTRRWLHIALFSAMLLIAPAHAQNRPGGLVGNQVYATDLLGRDVRSSDDIRVGTIADLVMDPPLGLVALLDVGEQPNRARGSVTVPFSRLRLGPDRWLVTDMTHHQFRDAASARYRAGDLLGKDVHTGDDSKIGTVKNLVVDPFSRHMVAAVIEVAKTGSPSGSAHSHVAIPLARLRFDHGRMLVTDLHHRHFHDGPGIVYKDDED